jgi:hypothetical protein
LQGSSVRLIRSLDQALELGAAELDARCFGPEASAVMNGRLISVWLAEDSSILAFSAASLRRCRASLSFFRSMPLLLLELVGEVVDNRMSKSSPPRKVSPLVDFTSKTPSPISRIEMSKVPPPRSKTAMVLPVPSCRDRRPAPRRSAR